MTTRYKRQKKQMIQGTRYKWHKIQVIQDTNDTRYKGKNWHKIQEMQMTQEKSDSRDTNNTR